MTSRNSSTQLAKPPNKARPLFHTKRNPKYSTDGPAIGLISAELGAPLMPWQQEIANVASERNPDGSYRYPIVVVSVPRQAGKTTLLRAVGMFKLITRDGIEVFYTAQTGKDARDRWSDLVKVVQRSKVFQDKFTIFKAAGQEKLILWNGSAFRTFSPTATALHGYTPPAIFLDEAFAFDEQRGDDLMAAIIPAQITLKEKQLWIVSTAGTSSSTFLKKWIDAGRAGQDGIAIFEYAVPDGLDPKDPKILEKYHPAIGYTQTTESILAAAESMSSAEFARAFGNQWTSAESHTIAPELWDKCAKPLAPPSGPIIVSYEVAFGRKAGTILGSWINEDGLLCQKIIQHEPGIEWMLPALERIRDTIELDGPLIADDGGETRQVTDALRRAGIEPNLISGRDHATAFGIWLRKIETGELIHDNTPQFRSAALGLVTRYVSDTVIPSRRMSPADISPVIAAVSGAWKALRPANDKPFIYLPEA